MIVPISASSRPIARLREGISPFDRNPIYLWPDGTIRHTAYSEPSPAVIPQTTGAAAGGSGLTWDNFFDESGAVNWFGLAVFGAIVYGLYRMVD